MEQKGQPYATRAGPLYSVLQEGESLEAPRSWGFCSNTSALPVSHPTLTMSKPYNPLAPSSSHSVILAPVTPSPACSSSLSLQSPQASLFQPLSSFLRACAPKPFTSIPITHLSLAHTPHPSPLLLPSYHPRGLNLSTRLSFSSGNPSSILQLLHLPLYTLPLPKLLFHKTRPSPTLPHLNINHLCTAPSLLPRLCVCTHLVHALFSLSWSVGADRQHKALSHHPMWWPGGTCLGERQQSPSLWDLHTHGLHSAVASSAKRVI